MIPNLPLYTLMILNMKDNGFKSFKEKNEKNWPQMNADVLAQNKKLVRNRIAQST